MPYRVQRSGIDDLGFGISDFGFRSRAACGFARRLSAFRLPHLSPHKSQIINPKSRRRGVSLLEVLISMFVLTVGLLGLAAMIPVGRYAMTQTTIADRAGTCGRAAMHEVKVREMMQYPYWRLSDSTQWLDGTDTSTTCFAIDPLGMAAHTLTSNVGTFSVNGSSTAGPLLRRNLGLEDASGNIVAMTGIQADSLFYWPDQLLFDNTRDDARARRIVTGNGGSGITGPYPVLSGESHSFTGTIVPQIEADFSWFLTVQPSPAEATLTMAEKRYYTVSVVTCFKRGFTTGSEVFAAITAGNFVGGIGGCMVTFDTTNYNPPGDDDETAALTTVDNLRSGRWVALCYVNSGSHCVRFSWYRVANTGADDTVRRLTLEGPDWTSSDLPNRLIIVDGVVGVYTTMVEVSQ